MDISSVNSDLIRGNATTIILSSLWSNDRYGYEILQEIDEKSQGQYKLKQATLYNQLKKLEKAGLISSYEGAPDDTGGGRRRYYALTAEGRAFLSKEKREYEYSRTILDKLVSEEDFDLSSPAPFDTENLRPYTKTGEEDEKPKIVYKEKIVEKPVEVEVIKEVEVEKVVEKVVEVEKLVEKPVYFDLEGNEITEDEAKSLIDKQADIKAKEELANYPKPLTINELFEKMDNDNGVIQPQKSAEQSKPNEHSYFNAFASENETRTRSESSMQDLFAYLDKKEAAIDRANQQNEQTNVYTDNTNRDFLKSELEPSSGKQIYNQQFADTFAISATYDQNSKFAFEDDDTDYHHFFASIVNAPDESDTKSTEQPRNDESGVDLRTRLYSKGFKIRPYDRGNTSEYYTFNFLQSNRINRDCWLIILAFFALEIGIMWASLFSRISFKYFLPILLVGAALMLIPEVAYILNPTKRIRAKFNFKLSILNRSMMFIELTVICILIGFFAVGISVNDMTGILETIILPMVLLTNLPLSSVIYYALYQGRKYHVA